MHALTSPARPLALATTLATALFLGIALYAALRTPGSFDLSTARGPHGARVVSWIALTGPAADAGVRIGDSVVRGAAQGLPPGSLVVRDGRRRIVLTPAALTPAPLDLLDAALGLGLCALGVLVLRGSADWAAGLAFWRLCLLAGLALALLPAARHGVAWTLLPESAATLLFGPALVALARALPGRRRGPEQCAVTLALWAPAVLVVLNALVCWWWPVAQGLARSSVAYVVIGGYILAAGACILAPLRRPLTADERMQFHWLAVGLLGGLAPFELGTLLPLVLTGRAPLAPEASSLALALLMVGAAGAIVRAEYLGITRLVPRRTLQVVAGGTVLSGATVAVEALIAAGPRRWGWPAAADVAVAGGLVGLGAVTLYPRLARWAERLVLHEADDPAGALRAAGGEVARACGADATLAAAGPLVVTRLATALQLTDALLLAPHGQWAYAHPRTVDPVATRADVVARALHLWMEPATRETVVMRAAGRPILVVPIADEADLHAVLCLGPKRSGEDYTAGEHAALGTLGAHLALIFDKHHLHQRLAEQRWEAREAREAWEAARAAPVAPPVHTPDSDAADAADAAGSSAPAPIMRLSRRQMETLAYLAEGATNREIAARMGVGEKAVEKHVAAIFMQLDVGTRTAAVAMARRARLLPLD